MDSDDAGATLAGAVGGLLNWLTTPSGKRALAAGIVAGAAAGYGLSAVLRWQHPDIPGDVRVFCSCVAGLVSLVGVSFVADSMVRVRQRADKAVREKLEPGVAPDGPHAGTGPPDAVDLPRADGRVPAVGGGGLGGPADAERRDPQAG